MDSSRPPISPLTQASGASRPPESFAFSRFFAATDATVLPDTSQNTGKHLSERLDNAAPAYSTPEMMGLSRPQIKPWGDTPTTAISQTRLADIFEHTPGETLGAESITAGYFSSQSLRAQVDGFLAKKKLHNAQLIVAFQPQPHPETLANSASQTTFHRLLQVIHTREPLAPATKSAKASLNTASANFSDPSSRTQSRFVTTQPLRGKQVGPKTTKAPDGLQSRVTLTSLTYKPLPLAVAAHPVIQQTPWPKLSPERPRIPQPNAFYHRSGRVTPALDALPEGFHPSERPVRRWLYNQLSHLLPVEPAVLETQPNAANILAKRPLTGVVDLEPEGIRVMNRWFLATTPVWHSDAHEPVSPYWLSRLPTGSIVNRAQLQPLTALTGSQKGLYDRTYRQTVRQAIEDHVHHWETLGYHPLVEDPLFPLPQTSTPKPPTQGSIKTNNPFQALSQAVSQKQLLP